MEWCTVSCRRASNQRCYCLNYILHESYPQKHKPVYSKQWFNWHCLGNGSVFLMACCLLLVTVTAFIRVTVRLCAFVKPSNVKCAELTITGKRQKSANNIRYSMSQYQVSAKTDKGIIQADCLSKTYSKVIPGQTCGLFYSLDKKTVKVSLSEKQTKSEAK